jgi:hypothetical protein
MKNKHRLVMQWFKSTKITKIFEIFPQIYMVVVHSFSLKPSLKNKQGGNFVENAN